MPLFSSLDYEYECEKGEKKKVKVAEEKEKVGRFWFHTVCICIV